MRLANLLRRTSPFVPSRAGIPPTWDRPDPPTSGKFSYKQRLSIDEKHFTFSDGGSPTYILVNTEVYEGDVVEAMPNFFGRFGLLLLSATVIGSLGFLFGSSHDNDNLYGYLGVVESLETQKVQYESKYGLKDIQNNPWKLNSWPETFQYNEDGPSRDFYSKCQTVEMVRKVNNEAHTYWKSQFDKAAEEVKKGHHH